jgi:hypothetical protein
MLRKFGSNVRNQWAGFLSLFLVLGGGTAYAVTELDVDSVKSKHIVDGEVRASDLAASSVSSNSLRTNAIPRDGQGFDGSTKLATDSVGRNELLFDTVTGDYVNNGSLTGGDIANGSIGSPELTNNAWGGRAYGRVSAGGLVSRSKNIAFVSHPATGYYCIHLAADSGINAGSAVVIVGSDFAGNGTNPSGIGGAARISVPEWDSAALDCPNGTLEVQTFVQTTSGDGSNSGKDDMDRDDEPFAFVIP